MNKRIVITGLGVVSPIGVGKDAFLAGLKEGRSGITKISRFDPYRLSSQIGGEVKEFSFEGYIRPKLARHMDRATRMGTVAVKEALRDAHLQINAHNSRRTAILVGTALGPVAQGLRFHDRIRARGPKRATPYFMIFSPDACASYLAVELGVRGANATISTGCSSAANAIAIGFDLLQLGRYDIILVCGTEAPLHETIMAPFCTSGVLSGQNKEPERASRPFDLNRDGFVMAEGAGAMVLETEGEALRRGAPVYAELAGYGTTCDPFSVSYTAPTPNEMVNCMELALHNSSIHPKEVDYINAYANGMKHTDALEASAIKAVFDDHVKNIFISSTKSMLGHSLGASAMLETIATILGIQYSFVPPSINYEDPDPEIDLDHIPNHVVKKEINIAIKNSFSFGNRNITLVLRRYFR